MKARPLLDILAIATHTPEENSFHILKLRKEIIFIFVFKKLYITRNLFLGAFYEGPPLPCFPFSFTEVSTEC